MEIDGLVAVGGILSLALGICAIILVRRQEEIIWNKMISAHLLSWMFISRGLTQAITSFTIEDNFLDLLIFIDQFLDFTFVFSIVLLSFIFPIPLIRNKKQLFYAIFGLVCIGIIATFSVILNGVNHPMSSIHINLYIVTGTIWTIVYLKFRFMPGKEDDSEIQGIANAALLLNVLLVGYTWFKWTGLYTQSEFFYNQKISSLPGAANALHESQLYTDYLWSMNLAVATFFGLTMFVVEIYRVYKRRGDWTSYLVIIYMVLGIFGQLIHGFESVENSSFRPVWELMTSTLHYTLIRPLLALLLLFRFGLIRIEDRNRSLSKTMSIILIVVASSAIIEIIQSLIPITELVSAGILGLAIAFAIGWEERLFNLLVSNPIENPNHRKEYYFPIIIFDSKEMELLDRGLFIAIIIGMSLAVMLVLIGVPAGGGVLA